MNAPDSAVSEGIAAPMPANRVSVIDVARGIAIVLMILYHTCWDLTFLNLARFDLFGDALWLTLRSSILSLFLGLVGIGLVLATRHGIHWNRVLSRLAVIGGCAVVVTVASRLTMPDSFIFFGVLHHIVVASVLGLACVGLPLWLVLVSALTCLAAPYGLAHGVFDHDWLRWIGLMTHEPRSSDYVPMLPWFGVELVGIALGRAVIVTEGAALWHWRPVGVSGRLLDWAGRRSLMLYMVHQPIVFGGLYLLVVLGGAGGVPGGTVAPAGLPDGPALPEKSEGFLGSCQVSCEKSGGTLTRCATYCRCVVVDLNGRGLWRAFLASKLDDAGKAQLMTTLHTCAGQSGDR